MDDVLSERMMIVVNKNYYEQTSFIRLGPIKKIEELHDDSAVYVLNSASPKEFEEQEVQFVADALMERIHSAPKTLMFNSTRTRDQLLLLADLVELFGALAIGEIERLFQFFVPEEDVAGRVKRMMHQLCFFELVEKVKTSNRTYFVAPEKRRPYLNYSSGKEKGKFERAPSKMAIFESLKKDSVRLRAYQKVHGAK